jgi:putative ABC transport system permease protein
LLTESLLLGLCGGAAGVALAAPSLRLILAIVPPGSIPDESEIAISTPVLAFSFAACLASTILFGLAPALHAAGGGLARPLPESGRGGAGRSMGRLRAALVVAELGLAVVLLAAAGLYLKNFLTLQYAPLGVQVENRLVFRVPLSEERYPSVDKRNAFYFQLLERLEAIPGVHSVGLNDGLHPLGLGDMPVEIPSRPGADPRPVNVSQISHRYPQTLAIPLLAGRGLTASDIAAGRRLAVAGETFARRYFPGQSPLGKLFTLPRLSAPPFSLQDPTFEIVGLSRDAFIEFHNADPHAEVFIPFTLTGHANIFVLHTAGDPLRYAEPVRRAAAALDPAQFIDDVYALPSLIDTEVLGRGRFRLWLMGAFAAAGLGLAAIGVYGLLAGFVNGQRRELGVRLALGATGARLLRLVLSRGLRLVGAGIAAGLAAAWLLLRLYGDSLGVADPLDPASLLLAAAALLAVAAAACLPPALRAAAVDPIRSLRHE